MDVFPLLLFPPLEYFKCLKQAKNSVVDLGEHYQKQSYRNRFQLMGPNNLQTISLQVEGLSGIKTPIKKVRLSDELSVNKVIRTLDTCYNASAFYEHYRDDVLEIFQSERKLLSEISWKGLEFMCEQFDLDLPSRTETYIEKEDEGLEKDHRAASFRSKEAGKYHQVYQDRHGFIPNLSALDALFNLGNTAQTML
jgi:hypothetical protein